MGLFRHTPEVRTAQAALDTYTAGQIKAGNHEITSQYEQLNQNVNDALKAEKKAKKRG
jgi:hypothetical protein